MDEKVKTKKQFTNYEKIYKEHAEDFLAWAKEQEDYKRRVEMLEEFERQRNESTRI